MTWSLFGRGTVSLVVIRHRSAPIHRNLAEDFAAGPASAVKALGILPVTLNCLAVAPSDAPPPTARHNSNWPPVEKRRQFKRVLGRHPTGGLERELATCPKFRGKSGGFSPGQVVL